jgi:hypothetical protein
MIPVSFSWDTRGKSIGLKWNGFLSLRWENGKVLTKILGLPIPFRFRQKETHFPIRWVYLKGAFSFLTKWKLKKMEGTLSFPEPMLNGLLYGWISAIETERGDRKINMTVNFLGENRCSGEATLSPKVLLHHLRGWILPLFNEVRRRRPRRGGKLI